MCLKAQTSLCNKGPYIQGCSLSSNHVHLWELEHKEGRAWKSWCFQTVVLEVTLESPLDHKEIKPVNPKGNQPWIFIGRTDAEAEAPILGPPDVKNWLSGKDPNAGKAWRQEEKGTTEDEMVGWHHGLNGHESEQAPGGGEGQGSLACCNPWVGHDLATEQQKNLTVNKKNTLWTGWVYPRNKRLTQHSKKSVEFSVSAYKRKTISKTAENHLLTIPTTTRLHALKGWILWYVN